MQWLYLIGAILGAILPLSQFFPFLATHGFAVPLLFQQLFQNHVSAFFGLDVIVSSFVLWGNLGRVNFHFRNNKLVKVAMTETLC